MDSSIQYVKGVGPFKAELLKKVGIVDTSDLPYYFPRDHQDRRVSDIRHAAPGRKTTFRAKVLTIQFQQVGKMLGQARAVLEDTTGKIEAIWFKRMSFQYDVFATLKKDFLPETDVLVYGEIEMGKNGLQILVEDQEKVLAGSETLHANRIVPVYPLTEGLQDRWLRSLIYRFVSPSSFSALDPLPDSLRDHHQLMGFTEALRKYHFPNNLEDRDKARHRLAFDEFFFLELALAMNRQDREKNLKGFESIPKRHLLTPFKAALGYEFTKAQIHAINEIFRDMARPMPMNRLLQGDVGSGKTVVALSAALLAIENGAQVALLAPTEILASQHALAVQKFFATLPIKHAFLSGSTKGPERKKIIQRLASGHVSLLVGTHAILSEDVTFQKLGLVIIDEQHRFGVRQRAKLLQHQKDETLIENTHPDVLIMTATPIPRTLALTLYGDLDVSVINESPPGRPKIRTVILGEAEALKSIENSVQNGDQAYIVFPLVEESEKLAKRNGKIILAATKEYERLKLRFPNKKLGLLHGQMGAEEKKEIMDMFRQGALHILVATPVIEVGIDVPNATTIVIMNPERFGLAQLHQLRGRVGRGQKPSQCILVNAVDQEESQRLLTFCSISDGFELAEEDLKMRGPGEFLGEMQHGVPFFRVGNLIKDGLLIAQARQAAHDLVDGVFPLTFKEAGEINRVLLKRFGSKIRLSNVG